MPFQSAGDAKVWPSEASVAKFLDPDSSCQSQFNGPLFLSFVSSLIRTAIREGRFAPGPRSAFSEIMHPVFFSDVGEQTALGHGSR